MFQDDTDFVEIIFQKQNNFKGVELQHIKFELCAPFYQQKAYPNQQIAYNYKENAPLYIENTNIFISKGKRFIKKEDLE